MWDYTEHTRAKHEILERYLDAWLAILSSNPHNRLLLIDGFAGRGEYNDGSKGSPVRMFNRAARAVDDGKAARVVIRCAEADPANHAALRSVTADLRHEKVDLAVRHTTFDDLGGEVADWLDGGRWATFVMVDPYGFAGVPLDLIRRLLAHDRVEVLLTFLVESMARWLTYEPTEDALSAFFGGPAYRECDDAADRAECLLLKYREVVVPDPATYATVFTVYRDDRASVLYYLVHLTNDPLGMRRMKEAMVRQSGDLVFWPLTVRPRDQIEFDLSEPKPHPTLQQHLAETYAGQHISFVGLLNQDYPDGTWVESHYRAALKDMEGSGRVAINRIVATTPTGRPKTAIGYDDEIVFP
jgi:three-Cys-motif partner protein